MKQLSAVLYSLLLSLVLIALCSFSLPEKHYHFLVANVASSMPLPFQWLHNEPAPGPDIFHSESILHLVKATVTDSLLTKKTQRQRYPGGFFTSALGLNWEYILEKKQTLVGSVAKPFHLYDGPEEEYDLNMDLIPNVAPSVNLFLLGLNATRETGRPMKYCIFAMPPFKAPEVLRYNAEKFYAIGCELTVPEAAREVLDQRFLFAAQDPKEHEIHPGFGKEFPSVGVYGPFVKDCNHNCRPEIHPIQWMWWMAPDTTKGRAWHVMLTTDGSGRFNDWVASPLQGEIDLPFTIEENQKQPRICVEPVFWDEPLNGEITIASEIYTVLLPSGESKEIEVEYPQHPDQDFSVSLHQVQALVEGTLFGWIRLHVTAKSIFAGRVRIA